ncbi:hypothetical protein AC579_2273 [Pseudocercospora musae]|uniref:ABM domain-containing protein n=1 Tax=Pseudocercospora musae TaxID=113226 RepID=A0A139IUX4_9PEZI|nr:hypothetical protein AC579_2273 [Pseudocercospora musae]
MASNKQTTTALLTEHFRYTPLTLLDDIINTVNELVFRAVNAIEEGFAGTTAEQLGFELDKKTAATLPNDQARRDALSELKQNEIDNGIVKLESLLNATVDKDFDKFEIYTLRNILSVGHEDDLANWVRLDHYKGVDVVNSEEVPTPEAVEMQRRKLHETAKLTTLLKAEEAKNAAVLQQLSALIGAEPEKEGAESSAPLGFLNAAQNAAQTQHLTQDTQYALSQLPALQQLLEKLKDAMQSLPAAARQSKYEDEDGPEARRRRYLESQSRRALERTGIDPDSAAGASLAAGRKMGRDELEGIEAVAQALGGAEKKRDAPFLVLEREESICEHLHFSSLGFGATASVNPELSLACRCSAHRGSDIAPTCSLSNMLTHENVTLVVIVTTKPGKGELTSEEYYHSFKDKEPDCIQFQFHKDAPGANENGNETWLLVERYASKAALDLHRSSEGHQKMFKDFQELDLLLGMPVMFEGSPVFGHS